MFALALILMTEAGALGMVFSVSSNAACHTIGKQMLEVPGVVAYRCYPIGEET